MLPKELLEVRKSKGKIIPKFAGKDDYPLAEKIIKIFSSGVGKKYGSVLSALKSVENADNYRKVRGFARVMERFCEKVCMFDAPSHLDPVEVRLYLFERGYITSRKERQRIIEYAARYFSTTPEEIERAMFADRDEEQILVNVRQINADTLIKLYNLSLLQTAIFNALRLTFWTSSNHKEIFRRIKWLGLMYELYEEDGQLRADITGTASILKMTRKYGTSMAKLIPSIVKAERWWIRAEILDEHSNRIYYLEMDDSHKHLFPVYDEKIEYDSSLEVEFERKIKAIKPDVEVIREPDVVKAGRYAFIPDFLIRKSSREVYVEIVGFWTEDYLKKKVEKIRESGVPLIVVAREEYACGKSESADVILFSKNIPYNEVVGRINHYLRGDISEISFEGDVVNLKELSNSYGVPVNEIVGVLPQDYVLAGSYAVKKDVFERIRNEVEKINPEKLSDVIPVLREFDVGYDVLRAMGYEIVWIGLSEEDAIVKRIK